MTVYINKSLAVFPLGKQRAMRREQRAIDIKARHSRLVPPTQTFVCVGPGAGMTISFYFTKLLFSKH